MNNSPADGIKYFVVPYTSGHGIGPKGLFAHFLDDGDGPLDFVFSSYELQNAADHIERLTKWWSKIRDDGYLVVHLPHADLNPVIGEPGATQIHDFRPADIRRSIAGVAGHSRTGFDLIINEVRGDGFLQVYRKTAKRQELESWRTPRPANSVCVVRYGGFGDHIQASGIFPELKRRGYHVAMMTTPRGRDILKHDPHIDEFIVQDDDQIPNEDLARHWNVWKPQFAKWVNLCESVEASLLAIPGKSNHAWPHAVRHMMMNVNYGEFTAALAELPYESAARFYASDEEKVWADEFVSSLPGPMVLYVLAGSSIHKFYPWQDSVIARIMMETDCTVVTVGEAACKILEQGWENESRVVCKSGEISIRETMALAQRASVVIGPETGVLNAVAFDENVGKVILLSHSSVENLTKHWVRTESLEPPVPCHPCHRMHYSDEFCPIHKDSGAAICAAAISPDDVFAAVVRQLETVTHETV